MLCCSSKFVITMRRFVTCLYPIYPMWKVVGIFQQKSIFCICLLYVYLMFSTYWPHTTYSTVVVISLDNSCQFEYIWYLYHIFFSFLVFQVHEWRNVQKRITLSNSLSSMQTIHVQHLFKYTTGKVVTQPLWNIVGIGRLYTNITIYMIYFYHYYHFCVLISIWHLFVLISIT